MVHAGQDADEFRLHHVDLLQRERRLIELAGAELGSYDVIDRFLDLLGCEILEHTQRGLDRIGQHRDGGLDRARPRTGVAIVFPARGPVTLLLGAVVEIGDLAGAMMLRDERGHDRGEASLLGKGEPVGHVALDDLRRLRRRNLVMRVAAARLVFDEIQRVAEFPDVVVVAAHAAQQAVRPDTVARRFDEVRHRHAVGVRPRRLERQASQ